MKREPIVIAAVFLVLFGVLALFYSSSNRGPNVVADYYTLKVPAQPDSDHVSATKDQFLAATTQPAATPVYRQILWPETIGLWLAALLTLAIFSFLYRDNPFYKTAEHIFVGISAAYWMTVGFWSTVVPNLLAKLFPWQIKFSLQPSLNLDEVLEKNEASSWFGALVNYASANGDGLRANWLQLCNFDFFIPLVLGIMLLWRLSPKGGWISRWPLAFIIGTTAGLRLIAYLGADFVKQIDSTIVPLLVPIYLPNLTTGIETFSFGDSFYASMNNMIVVFGVLCGLIYFFFSLEHKGVVGVASRIGIYILMISFGGGFGYTVMGRVTLLSARFRFLVKDWLNLIST